MQGCERAQPCHIIASPRSSVIIPRRFTIVSRQESLVHRRFVVAYDPQFNRLARTSSPDSPACFFDDLRENRSRSCADANIRARPIDCTEAPDENEGTFMVTMTRFRNIHWHSRDDRPQILPRTRRGFLQWWVRKGIFAAERLDLGSFRSTFAMAGRLPFGTLRADATSVANSSNNAADLD